MFEPLLGVVIPTMNRADLLDDTLGRLEELKRFQIPYEIVISDNLSSDRTAEVIRKRQETTPTIRHVMQPSPVKSYLGFLNGVRNSTARYIVLLADDDSLVLETLVGYVQQMERDSNLVTIVADWMAYDDEQERELHRYFQFTQPTSFGPESSVEMVNFILNHRVLPEQNLYRREALLRSECHVGRGSYHLFYWIYRLARQGKVAFELAPFYREHRVLKPQFRQGRGVTGNLSMRLELIGDEFRNQLETLLLWSVQERGHGAMPSDQVTMAKHMIDNFLHGRLPLEIDRAIAEKNWLLACDLRRRWVLWHGPGSAEQQGRDVNCLVLPAAMQSVERTYRELTGASGLLFYGFLTDQLHSFFRNNYPDIPLVDFSALETATATSRPLVVLKNHEANIGRDVDPNYCVYLSDLFDCCRINTLRLDLSQL